MPLSDAVMHLTFSTLSQYIPNLSEIVALASFAHLYQGKLDEDVFSWSTTPVAGSLFLCSSTDGQYHVVILSRKGLTNFFWTLTSTDGMECDPTSSIQVILNPPSGYPMTGIPKLENTCYGIWIYERSDESTAGEAARMASAILECAKVAEKRNGQKELAVPVTKTPQPQITQAPPTAHPMAGISILSQVFPQAAQQQVPQYQPQVQAPQYQQDMAQVQAMQHQQAKQIQDINANTNILNMLFEKARYQGH
ncbi:hypothetical protein EDC01DRAFT_616748 [Geopyxis carbonaria]|nr:hypothetical protein EDC01DRAFT_616748 [Geopyxis carbonaria]